MKHILFTLLLCLFAFNSNALIRNSPAPQLHSIFDKPANNAPCRMPFLNGQGFADPCIPSVDRKKAPGTSTSIVGGAILGAGAIGFATFFGAHQAPQGYTSPEMLLWVFGSIVVMIIGAIVLVTGIIIAGTHHFQRKDSYKE